MTLRCGRCGRYDGVMVGRSPKSIVQSSMVLVCRKRVLVTWILIHKSVDHINLIQIKTSWNPNETLIPGSKESKSKVDIV